MNEFKTALALLLGDKRLHRLAAFALGATLIGSLLPSLPPYLMKQVIDNAVIPRDGAALLQHIGLYLGALVLEVGFVLASQTALATLGQRSMHALRTRMFGHLQSLDLAYFEREPRGRVLTRLTSDVEALSEMFTSGAVTMVSDMVAAVALFATMLWLDWKLTLIAFLTVPPLVVMAEVFRRKARDAFRAVRAHTAKLNGFTAESLAGATVIAAFDHASASSDEFRKLNAALNLSNRQAIAVDATLFAVVEAIGSIAVAAMLYFAAPELLAGTLGIGVLVAFIQYVQRFFIPIRDLSAKFTIIQSGFAAAERVTEFLALEPTLRDGPTAELPGRSMLPVTLDGVSFSYPNGAAVLREVTLSIAAGKKIALIGPTGAGKTTIVKLLLRLVDPTAGQLTLAGVDARELTLAALRRNIAIVPQEPIIFAATARENLRAFDARITDAAIMEAAASVGAHHVLARLPEGLDTPLSERGSNLSSGEAQLIAFTRALLAEPELLILDEATSSIDAASERLVTDGLAVLLERRAALVIAHRLATLRMCDEIIVLKDGRIAERGSHAELLARQGVYAALYELQFQTQPDAKADAAVPG